jgi:hypothetical protein
VEVRILRGRTRELVLLHDLQQSRLQLEVPSFDGRGRNARMRFIIGGDGVVLKRTIAIGHRYDIKMLLEFADSALYMNKTLDFRDRLF